MGLGVGEVAHACDPSALEVHVGGAGIQGHP